MAFKDDGVNTIDDVVMRIRKLQDTFTIVNSFKDDTLDPHTSAVGIGIVVQIGPALIPIKGILHPLGKVAFHAPHVPAQKGNKSIVDDPFGGVLLQIDFFNILLRYLMP